MITNVQVDGFRSLSDFNIGLKQGLNVLVGPNGAGKTNIIDAMTFIRNVVTSDLHSAVSSAGGSQSVFSKERLSKKGQASEAHFSISGMNELDMNLAARRTGYRVNLELGKAWVFFEYSFTTVLKQETAFLGVSSQSLRFKFYPREPNRIPTQMKRLKWDFEVVSNCPSSYNLSQISARAKRDFAHRIG